MIHKTAIIDSKAKISTSAKIGAYSVIGPNVEIGDNTIIHSQVNISGNTIIGKGNKIYPFAAIGNDPQDLKFNDEETKLIIGDNNKIREYVTIHPGTKGGGGLTKIGDKNMPRPFAKVIFSPSFIFFIIEGNSIFFWFGP